MVSFPTDLGIHDLVLAQAAHRSGATALRWEGDTFTYAVVADCSRKLAALLSVHGVAPDCVVALQLHRSLEQVAGVVGALRSCGAYLPLDSKWPLERRKFMVDDAPCAQLVAPAPHAAEFQGWF